MNVTWINGTIAPQESGDYYIAIEALKDIPLMGFKKGDVEITTDYYEASEGYWDEIGKDNPYWKVVCWARIRHPDIPEDLRGRVKMYFGREGSRLEGVRDECVNCL